MENDYKLRLTPLRKSEFLVNGYALVTRQERALLRVEGRTSKRFSFWVGEADVVQDFANYDGFWMPHRTESTAQVRLVGKTELTIESETYHFLKSR